MSPEPEKIRVVLVDDHRVVQTGLRSYLTSFEDIEVIGAASSGEEILAAAVLNSLWINDAVISYLHFQWTMFGTLRERIDNVPVLAAIHVWATLPPDVMFP